MWQWAGTRCEVLRPTAAAGRPGRFRWTDAALTLSIAINTFHQPGVWPCGYQTETERCWDKRAKHWAGQSVQLSLVTMTWDDQLHPAPQVRLPATPAMPQIFIFPAAVSDWGWSGAQMRGRVNSRAAGRARGWEHTTHCTLASLLHSSKLVKLFGSTRRERKLN